MADMFYVYSGEIDGIMVRNIESMRPLEVGMPGRGVHWDEENDVPINVEGTITKLDDDYEIYPPDDYYERSPYEGEEE